MKILAIEKEKPGLRPVNFEPHLEDEASNVWKLYLEGFIREIYFNETNNAVLVLEAEDKNSAQKKLNEFPLVKEGLITFDLVELKPYSGLSRLFMPEKI